MPAGFEVTNSYGTAMITDTSVVFSLLAKGSFSYSESNTTLTIALPRAPVNAILAVVPKAAPVTFNRVFNGNGMQLSYSVGSTIAQSFEWFLFDSAPPTPNSINAGLEVYKDNGTLVYASQTPVMKIVDFAYNHFTYSRVVPAGKKYAVALANTYTYRITEVYASLESTDPEYDWYRQNTRITNSTASYKMTNNAIVMTELTSSQLIQGTLYRVVSDDPPPFPESYKEEFLGQTTALVVDVTNY